MMLERPSELGLGIRNIFHLVSIMTNPYLSLEHVLFKQFVYTVFFGRHSESFLE